LCGTSAEQGPRTKVAVCSFAIALLDAPITAEFVRGHIRRALACCGLADRFTGTHVLRHTVAVRMRCGGANLKEIADVLRHRSLDTTTIYNKLDVPTLATVAAPWPWGSVMKQVPTMTSLVEDYLAARRKMGLLSAALNCLPLRDMPIRPGIAVR
jgi:hypothetical protein